jgi:hypothetical protein
MTSKPSGTDGLERVLKSRLGQTGGLLERARGAEARLRVTGTGRARNHEQRDQRSTLAMSPTARAVPLQVAVTLERPARLR